MKKNILITGKPRSGKSTLIKKLIADIPNKVGFVTSEIAGENGRIGFQIETHAGDTAVLAHVGLETPYRVSRYSVDVQNLESMIPKVIAFEEGDFLYLDEIGQMELFSKDFEKLVLKYLDSPNNCLATLSCVFENDFTRCLKEREDIIIVEISAENRSEKEKFITKLIGKIEKAKKYVSEPQRFSCRGSEVELKSEHGTRTLFNKDKKWNCDCDFFKQSGICSHAIATQEFIKNRYSV